jgi:hypothetical protein
MEKRKKKITYAIVSIGFSILIAWGILIVFSIDVRGTRVLRGIAISKQLTENLCIFRKLHNQYPSNYDLTMAGVNSKNIKNFTYDLHNSKYFIQFKVKNILRQDTFFTVDDEKISIREGEFGVEHEEPVGKCE